MIEHRAACTTAYQDAIELARRHADLASDPVYRCMLAELERLALPHVTSLTSVARRMQRAELARRAVGAA